MLKLIFIAIILMGIPIRKCYIVSKSEVKISYTISEWSWFFMDFTVFWFSLVFMLSCSEILISINDIKYVNSINKANIRHITDITLTDA